MQTRSDQARARLREEMTRLKLTQRDVANLLTWSQSRVAKVLTGRVGLSLDDLGALCFALNLSMTEVVRDHGMEFCAEMTPTELRALETLRAMSPAERDAMITVMGVTAPNARRAMAVKTKRRKLA